MLNAEPATPEAQRLSILMVDDNPIDRETYRNFLAQDRVTDYEIVEVDSGEEALQVFDERSFDCVILDYNLPDLDGLEVLGQLVRDPLHARLPVVMLTGVGNEAIAVETMKRGCQDYVPKGDVTAASLVQAVHNAVEKVRLRRELERNQAALDQSRQEQLALKDRFLSHVSHELRTPLAAIDQFIALVLDGIAGEIPAEAHEYLGLAAHNVRQLAQMISDLMDAVRGQSDKLRVELRRISLADVVGRVVASFESRAEAQGVSLRAEIDPELPAVLADGTRVEQIVKNLLDNAIKFTPEGGCVEVSACRDPDEPDLARVCVADSGCGMSQQDVDRVFDRHYQAGGGQVSSRTGLGLGLAIARDLVCRHGGRIWAESRPGAGSCFRFTLPAFSMTRLLRPALLDGERLRDAYGVIRIRLIPGAGSERIPESASRRIHHAVSGLVYYPQIDVLLPRLLFDERGDVIFVVAATDSTGLKAMTDRLDRYLNRGDGGEAPIRVEIEGRCVAIERAAPPGGDLLERVAGQIEAIILQGGRGEPWTARRS